MTKRKIISISLNENELKMIELIKEDRKKIFIHSFKDNNSDIFKQLIYEEYYKLTKDNNIKNR